LIGLKTSEQIKTLKKLKVSNIHFIEKKNITFKCDKEKLGRKVTVSTQDKLKWSEQNQYTGILCST